MLKGPQSLQGYTKKHKEQLTAELRRKTVVQAGIGAFLFGLAFVGVSAWSYFAVATLYSLGFLALGIVTGFLFGVPKVLTHSNDIGTAHSSVPVRPPDQNLSVNTNLEQISDWLTKIVVGVGLVQLGHIPDYVSRLTYFMAQVAVTHGGGTNNADNLQGVALGIVLYFPVLGFLFGTVLTRLVLAPAFNVADTALGGHSGEIAANADAIKADLAKANASNADAAIKADAIKADAAKGDAAAKADARSKLIRRHCCPV
jgi:hypothetical protein